MNKAKDEIKSVIHGNKRIDHIFKLNLPRCRFRHQV